MSEAAITGVQFLYDGITQMIASEKMPDTLPNNIYYYAITDFEGIAWQPDIPGNQPLSYFKTAGDILDQILAGKKMFAIDPATMKYELIDNPTGVPQVKTMNPAGTIAVNYAPSNYFYNQSRQNAFVAALKRAQYAPSAASATTATTNSIAGIPSGLLILGAAALILIALVLK